jgi:hypothetical protein
MFFMIAEAGGLSFQLLTVMDDWGGYSPVLEAGFQME